MTDNPALPIAVFVDTNYLNRLPGRETASWNRLLRFSADDKVKIFLSEIVLDEWKHRQIDELITKITQAESALSKLGKEWERNFISSDNKIGRIIKPDILPSTENIKEVAEETFAKLVKDQKLNIITKTESHTKNTWHKYFRWIGVFNFCSPAERMANTNREARRKHIPDAWILEAAIDLIEKNRVICLGGDGNLCKGLSEEGITEHYKEAEEIIKLLEKSGSRPEADSHAPPQSPFQSLIEQETSQLTTVLGYVQWFAPIPKEQLSMLLEHQGVNDEDVAIAAAKLAKAGLILDTGKHYIPKNETACKEAADSIMPQILELLDEQ